MNPQKNIALIAHDNQKEVLMEWVGKHASRLAKHHLLGTGTTASLVQAKTGLPVEILQSGPLGGDQQIGARIVEGRVDILLFFWDPLQAQPHDPDVKALLRLATLYDLVVVTNQASADFLVQSPLLDAPYVQRALPQVNSVAKRLEGFLVK
ncbi:MAG: methylglyoxal synthase [Erysipelotrichaceae bacterium]